MTARVDVLILSGSMGSGKTTMLGEISDLLRAASMPHAAIDLDWLAGGWVPASAGSDLMYRNLAAVWTGYAAAGVTRAVIGEPVVDAAMRNHLAIAIPGARIVICRLRASVAVMRQRVLARELGILRHRYAARVEELEAILDAAAVEHFSVTNESRSITDVAREILERAGWMS